MRAPAPRLAALAIRTPPDSYSVLSRLLACARARLRAARAPPIPKALTGRRRKVALGGPTVQSARQPLQPAASAKPPADSLRPQPGHGAIEPGPPQSPS